MTRIASTHVFVDGNNVMGSRPDGWWRDRSAAARRLIAELDPVARARANSSRSADADGAGAKDANLSAQTGLEKNEHQRSRKTL